MARTKLRAIRISLGEDLIFIVPVREAENFFFVAKTGLHNTEYNVRGTHYVHVIVHHTN